jgi:hypothetical protein
MQKIHCLKCKHKTDTHQVNIGRVPMESGKNRFMMHGKCSKCGMHKSQFVSEQTAKGLLSLLGINTPLKNIPIIGPILG